jgi:uncharacterized membrane protein
MKNQKSFCIRLVASFLFFVVFIAILIWINQSLPGDVPTAASQIKFARAHVTKLISDEAKAEDWTEGLRIGVQEVYLQLDSGEDKGKILPAVNYMSVYNNVDLKVGTKVIARLDIDANGRTYIASIPNYNRGPALLGLTVIFVLFLAVFGGKKGNRRYIGACFCYCGYLVLTHTHDHAWHQSDLVFHCHISCYHSHFLGTVKWLFNENVLCNHWVRGRRSDGRCRRSSHGGCYANKRF